MPYMFFVLFDMDKFEIYLFNEFDFLNVIMK